MRRRGYSLLATVAVTVSVALSGCAGAPEEIAAGTSELMQSTIVTAAGQAASGDTVSALATLDSLQAQLQKAVTSGDITSERAESVQQSIDLVRADLQPAPTVAPVPEETTAPEETAAPVTTTDTAPDPAVPEPTTPDDPGNNGNGNGNNGNGNGNNGNGKNGNNGNGKNK